jgi:hypothetical protein
VTPSNACSLLKISFFRGFIKISVTWSRVFTNLSCTSFLTMHSLIKWYLVSMRVVYNFQQTTPLFFHWFGSSWSHTHIYIYIYICACVTKSFKEYTWNAIGVVTALRYHNYHDRSYALLFKIQLQNQLQNLSTIHQILTTS